MVGRGSELLVRRRALHQQQRLCCRTEILLHSAVPRAMLPGSQLMQWTCVWDRKRDPEFLIRLCVAVFSLDICVARNSSVFVSRFAAFLCASGPEPALLIFLC